MKSKKTILNEFLAEGFNSTRIDQGVIQIRCDQCVTMFICGIPTHEQGCPNIQKPHGEESEAEEIL